MAFDKDPSPFIKQEEFPMPEYAEIQRILFKEPDVNKFKEKLKEYQEKLKGADSLEVQKKIEYEKIVAYLKKSIARKDPQQVKRIDEKFLRDKFEKLNV